MFFSADRVNQADFPVRKSTALTLLQLLRQVADFLTVAFHKVADAFFIQTAAVQPEGKQRGMQA